MSIARHHAEWLSLLDIVGPFITMEVLLEVFPQGLAKHDPEHFALLKQAYQEWLLNRRDEQIHRVWVEWVLENTLDYPEDCLQSGQGIPGYLQVELKEYRETLKPDWAIIAPGEKQAQLLVQLYGEKQKLESPCPGKIWQASPMTRMVTLLQGARCPLGLVTNGEEWMLVHALPGEAVTTVTWYGEIWVEEKITLRAFRDLLGVERFFGVAPEDTLAQLFVRSKGQQQEVTDQLGLQVRKAVEILIQTIDRLNGDLQGELLRDISTEELYQAACFVMMRLVFLLCAEERGLLLLGDSRYEQHYAVSTLQESLRELADRYGEELLERRHDAWCRLLALFRAVHGGIFHDLFRLPAYGGDLFDPDKFPFLEGRFGERDHPIAVDNRTVLHLLESLQILRIRVPGGGIEPRRLSFKTIEVEQIGHVYEGLLDHQAVRAEVTVLGLGGTKNKEPEVALEELEGLLARSEGDLVKFLKQATGRSAQALRNALAKPLALSAFEEDRCLACCGNSPELWERIKPFFNLVRFDSYGYPLIIPAGSVFVTSGTDRRESGTHYTPSQLTQEIVKYTLDPLVYGEDGELISPQEILNLKICDPTMGSGAFLVQVCRYLADRLVESLAWLEKKKPEMIFTIFGEESRPALMEVLPEDEGALRRLMAKRIIAERCIYGVDKNPLAVEMAKLSLWLETLQKDKPFTFLDHALRCGDSLVGVTVEQLQFWSLDVSDRSYQLEIGINEVRQLLQEAISKRQELESFVVNSPGDQVRKGALLLEAQARLRDLRDRADLLVGSYLAAAEKGGTKKLRDRLLLVANGKGDIKDNERQQLRDLEEVRPFHWELEFPEVFLNPPQPPFERGENSAQQVSFMKGKNPPQHPLVRGENSAQQVSFMKGKNPPQPPFERGENSDQQVPLTKGDLGGCGFDAIVGNPPFMGGQKITGVLGTFYRDFIQEWIGNNVKGSADLVAYFFLKVANLIKQNGCFGLVATNTIAQGDTREVGLDQLVKQGEFYRAVPSRPWSGTAALEVAYVWFKKGQWGGKYILDGKEVKGITPYLTETGQATGKPHQLAANQNKSFQGSIVLGMGFVLEPEEAQALITKNPKNKDVLFPYLNGQDLNSNPDQSPSRWVINFKDWPLSPDHDNPKKPKGAPYASDYPDCLEILERLVKPEREKNKFSKSAREKWWLYERSRPELYEAIAPLNRVLVAARVSKNLMISFVSNNYVFNEMIVVFKSEKYRFFSLLQSSINDHWVWQNCSTMRDAGIRYSPTDGFETFPFPDLTPEQEKDLEDIGERYYQHRQQIMTETQLGLTKTYNRFHDPTETDSAIQKLRDLHQEMDETVAQTYGWTDLKLNHDFHETKQGLRFTISEPIRREILDRLLQLNHERYAAEVAQGLHNKGKKKKTPAKKKGKTSSQNDQQLGLDL
ncbi:Eco57I restriction-modification methylase domain-containing protein [Spirulina subsalsa]|uniref:Eco57I restriction-modification methylase domain-containing protein n=1 Tax=Spirulina subsalsa TaxID=54311 RepID=UPI0022385AB7|nr:DNA methyltransferase [Spirulina subsalsa]